MALGCGDDAKRAIRRRRLVGGVACAALAGRAAAQTKPVRIVVAFSPGGPVDAVARMLGDTLGQQLGRTVVIDNKPGGNGAIAALDVARAEPDGQTVWLTSVGAAAINPALYERLAYDMARDFAPVSLVANNVELLVANAADTARDAAEFVAQARRRPAGTVAMGSTGIGSIPHLAIEQLGDATGVKFLHVPYKGAAPAITDLIGGQIQGFFGDVPGLIGHVNGAPRSTTDVASRPPRGSSSPAQPARLEGGKLKALGIAASRRHRLLPDVKTLDEQGIAGVDTNNWYAFFVGAKTPPAAIDALAQALHRALATPAVRERMLQVGTEPAPSSAPELAALLRRDSDKWARLIKAKHIKAE
jgi:tripartite-type tricarboxylate transporter receptor subunit TctC